MHAILIDDALPLPVRVEVIDVLCLADDQNQKLPGVLALLLAEVARKDAPVDLRRAVMLRMLPLIPAGPSPARDQAVESYLNHLVDLQTDDVDLQIRLAAAPLLVVPEHVSTEKIPVFGENIVKRIGARLQEEKDDRVFAALVQVLKTQTEKTEALVSVVNTRLRIALTALGGDEKAANLVKQIVEGLRAIATKGGRTTAEWASTCETLLAHRKRAAIRNILDFQVLQDKGRQLGTEKKELQHMVWQLVLQTAALAPDDESWSDTGRSEAEMVSQAFGVLWGDGDGYYKKNAATLDTPRVRLTYLRCEHALGNKDAVIKQATLWLTDPDKKFTDADRHDARLLLAENYLNAGMVTEAWGKSGIQLVTGTLMERRLQIQERIAKTMLQQTTPMYSQALVLLQDLEAKTKKDAPHYWPRFRSFLEVRLQLDAKQRPVLLKELNDWVASQPKLTAEDQKQLSELRAKLMGDAGPGR